MRRSVTAPGGTSAALDAIATYRESPEDVAHAGNKTNSAEDEQENWLGMEPVVEKIAEESADDDSGDENEREFHGDSGLICGLFRLLDDRRG